MIAANEEWDAPAVRELEKKCRALAKQRLAYAKGSPLDGILGPLAIGTHAGEESVVLSGPIVSKDTIRGPRCIIRASGKCTRLM